MHQDTWEYKNKKDNFIECPLFESIIAIHFILGKAGSIPNTIIHQLHNVLDVQGVLDAQNPLFTPVQLLEEF